MLIPIINQTIPNGNPVVRYTHTRWVSGGRSPNNFLLNGGVAVGAVKDAFS